jgi:hypothetical protein
MGLLAAGASTTLLASSGTKADTPQPTCINIPLPAYQLNPFQKVVGEKVQLAPFNLTKVASENTVNVTLLCRDPLGRLSSCVSVDRKTFNKIRVRDFPNWWPEFFKTPPVVIREFTNTELLIAGIAAGASIDVIRSFLLYPIATVKARIQAASNRMPRVQAKMTPLRLKRRLLVLFLNIRRMVDEGKLYAGLAPTLLASVPATGIYFGARDVTKRLLNKMIEHPTRYEEIGIALTGALVGDIVSLAARTPLDVLALRRQVASGEDPDEDEEDLEVGDWVGDSIARLPAVIATDLPYLLSRITFNMVIAHGDEDIARYEVIAISTALACAILTTPFDVARTRILVDSDGDPSNGLDVGSNQGVIATLKSISYEGDGGVRNLFAGWFERAVYLGIGRAWIDPLLIIVYIAIRDAVLLEWFD